MELSGDFNRVVLLSDHASIPLTKNIYDNLKSKNIYGSLQEFDPDALYLNRFNNGECEIRVRANVRGRSAFVVKSFNTISRKFPYDYKNRQWVKRPELSDCMMNPDMGYVELFAINDALKRSSVSSITNVLMFMPYLRQDKKMDHGEPITARLMADLTKESGASRVVTIHPHFPQVGCCYDIPLDVLNEKVVFGDWILDNYKKEEIILMATDANSSKDTEKFANEMGVDYIVARKTRSAPGEVKSTKISFDGSLENKVVIIYDDIIDTGGSLINCVKAAKEKGAKKVIATITHPVLSCNAKQMLLDAEVELITTDSITIPGLSYYPNIRVISLGYLISEAISCITTGNPIHDYLFDIEAFRKVKRQKGL